MFEISRNLNYLGIVLNSQYLNAFRGIFILLQCEADWSCAALSCSLAAKMGDNFRLAPGHRALRGLLG